MKRNADRLAAIWEFHVSLPYMQRWVDQLVGEHERATSGLAEGARPRRCSAHRRDGQPCRNWAIRGGFVCRMHGGGAPQVKAKARQRLEAARIYREIMRETSGVRRPRA